MTEKEYLKILNQIALNYDAEYVNECHDDFCISMRSNIKQLENLIKEHFDNPPLKFEELKKDMWVWVKKLEGYYRISSVVDLTAENGKKYVDFGFGYIEFKENMFYRKQVQDE